MQVDNALARLFYANGLAFNLVKSPYLQEFCEVLGKYGPSYTLPSYNALREDLLEREYNRVSSMTTQLKSSLADTACTITSDGWTSVQNKPLLNVLMVTPKGNVFIGAEDTSGKAKTGDYIASVLLRHIDAVGPANVIAVITDSASNCKVAGKIIEEKHKHITWVPCSAHCLDLLLEDFGKERWIADVIADCKTIAQFITNHHASVAIFRTYSEHEIVKPAETRFATHFLLIDRLVKVKDSLQKTVIDEKYKAWTASLKRTVQDVADEVNDLVLSNIFWKKVADVVQLCEPIVKLLRLCDSGQPALGKVYWGMFKLQEHIAAMPSNKRAPLQRAFKDRWEMLHSDLHSVAYMLDPEYSDHDSKSVEEVMTGWLNVLDKMYDDEEDKQSVISDYSKYQNKEGIFARDVVWASAHRMPAWKWWAEFGATVPHLQKLAIKVLAQPTAAVACERSWSTYKFIHSTVRNRLQPKRANDLVFIFSNLRIAKQHNDLEYCEEYPVWDEDE